MLQEERFIKILKILDERKSATVQEFMDKLDSSESTIRRDLNQLHKIGKLIKVHGGAVLTEEDNISQHVTETEESALNYEDKVKIAKYAASLIKEGDFVYLDASRTISLMIDFISEKKAVFVTNSLSHSKKLVRLGFQTFILGGELKGSTEAIVGEAAVSSLKNYNFTKGFFGTNGIHIKRGFTTADLKEAIVKKEALDRCKESYILADNSKFNSISAVTFREFEKADIITTDLVQEEFVEYENVLGVDK